jgi:hypothetical protein
MPQPPQSIFYQATQGMQAGMVTDIKGSSSATAVISGVAALVYSRYPGISRASVRLRCACSSTSKGSPPRARRQPRCGLHRWPPWAVTSAPHERFGERNHLVCDGEDRQARSQFAAFGFDLRIPGSRLTQHSLGDAQQKAAAEDL